MLYALLLLLLVTAIYAILASQLFGDAYPELFGRFSIALFTVASAHWQRVAWLGLWQHTHSNQSLPCQPNLNESHSNQTVTSLIISQ